MPPAFYDSIIGNTECVDARHDDFFAAGVSAKQRSGGMMPLRFPAMNDLISIAKHNGMFEMDVRNRRAEHADDLQRPGNTFPQTWDRRLMDDNILSDEFRFSFELTLI